MRQVSSATGAPARTAVHALGIVPSTSVWLPLTATLAMKVPAERMCNWLPTIDAAYPVAAALIPVSIACSMSSRSSPRATK